ncbi:MAG: methylmalonyl Co-A mutase-associated GTPase MeaB, partial [Thermaceae bacterium]
PGAGKSTLTDRLIETSRRREERVAVLALDPSSPFTGGAILGDRIHHQDPQVFIRSLASRGALGGLAGATVGALTLLDAVQAFKAGVMEVADVFAINKFDLPGGERLMMELKGALELSPPRPGGWLPPIHPVVATTGQGVEEPFQSLEAHLVRHGLLTEHRLERARFEVESVIQEWGRKKTLSAVGLS